MNTCKLTNQEISQAVIDALASKQWSVLDCCNSYNAMYSKEIKKKSAVEMKKDFVHRVKKNQFSVVSKRVSSLCDFLSINLEMEKTSSFHLQKEIEKIEQVIRKNPAIKIKIKDLLKNVADLAAAS